MATAHWSLFLRRLTRGLATETLVDQSDRQLVEQYLARRDEAVYTALVRRHGPMVYRVCWRVLQQEQDAEDAFQATFLVLAQNLHSVRKMDSLASWLHGVAHRVALKAKAQAATRRRHEERAGQSQPVPGDEVTWGELRRALDAELAQLPDKWRLPLILCYLEARTQDEAARHLGWSRTTLQRRLADGRAALGRRLARRGVVWPAALSAVLLSECVAPAAPAPGLVGSTVEAAACVAAGRAATSAVSVKVAALTEGVLKTMLLSKLKLVTALVLVVAALSGAVRLIYQTQAAEQPKAQAVTEQADKEKRGAAKAAPKTDLDRLQGVWKLDHAEINGGTARNLEALKKVRLVIKGDKITLGKDEGHDETGSIKVDSTKQPKEIDLILTGPAGNPLTNPGIYKLDGDKLTICYAPHLDNGQDRPTEFDTKDGGRLWVLVRSAPPPPKK
jgi:RNA polymerase sigma factor (sigma-70 family)